MMQPRSPSSPIIRNRPIAVVILALLLSCNARGGDTLSIAFTGDIMLDRGVRRVIERAGIDSLFAQVAPLFRECDAVVGNLECPAVKKRTAPRSPLVFDADPGWLRGLRRSSITHLALANNHAFDQGERGFVLTADSMRAAGIIPLGCGVMGKDECAPALIAVHGIRVSIFNAIAIALNSGKPTVGHFAPCTESVAALEVSVREYRQRFPDDIILVILHWGTEYRTKPAAYQRAQARKLIDAGADGIMGHHPHVFQDAEFYKGKPIFYSLGNLVFDQRDSLAKRGAVGRVLIGPNHTLSVELYPIVIRHGMPRWARREEAGFLEDRLRRCGQSVLVSYRPDSR